MCKISAGGDRLHFSNGGDPCAATPWGPGPLPVCLSQPCPSTKHHSPWAGWHGGLGDPQDPGEPALRTAVSPGAHPRGPERNVLTLHHIYTEG